MEKTCTGCVVSAGTHKPAEALHQIDEKNSTLIADAKRLGFVADQIRALSPGGSDEDIYLTEASEVFAKCAERIAELEAKVQRAAEIERAAILLRVKNRAAAGALLVKDFQAIVNDRGPAPQAVQAAVPDGWVPCVITYEGQHPEEVAYGPQIMMDRLKKWLDRYFEMRIAPAHPAEGEVK